jgi:uncharacterized protein YkwD
MGGCTWAAGTAACVTLIALAGACAPPASAEWRDCPNRDVRPAPTAAPQAAGAMLCLLNAEREQYGLDPLRWNWRLWDAAQAMANAMVVERFFSHSAPNGTGLLARIARTGYLPDGDDWSLGENLGWGEGALGTPLAMVAGWMTSPGHRANVLAPDYRDVGIGYIAGAPLPGRSGGAVFVAEFGHSTETKSDQFAVACKTSLQIARERKVRHLRRGSWHAGGESWNMAKPHPPLARSGERRTCQRQRSRAATTASFARTCCAH